MPKNRIPTDIPKNGLSYKTYSNQKQTTVSSNMSTVHPAETLT